MGRLSRVALRPQYVPEAQSEPPALFPANSGMRSPIASSGWSDQELDQAFPVSPAAVLVVWIRREYSVTYAADGMNCTPAPAAPATDAARKSPKRSPAGVMRRLARAWSPAPVASGASVPRATCTARKIA